MSDAKTPEEHKKKLVRAKVNNAIRDGRMKKPKNCQICHKPCDHLQFHHENYKSSKSPARKGNLPKGRFICPSCHQKLTAHHKRKIKK